MVRFVTVTRDSACLAVCLADEAETEGGVRSHAVLHIPFWMKIIIPMKKKALY